MKRKWMNKRGILLLVGLAGLLLFPRQFWPQNSFTIEKIVPGVRHIAKMVPEFPWAIHILEIDLHRPGLSIQTIKAGDRVAAREKTSEMAARAMRAGRKVIAAMNGDFFAEDGTPINLQITGGEIVRAPSDKSILAFTAAGKPVIGYFRLSASVTAADGRHHTIDNINARRQTDQMVFYNRFWGKTTGTNQYGTEVRLRPLKPFFVNDSLPMVVEALQRGGPAMRLDGNRYVLSGHDSAALFLQNHVAVRDTLVLFFRLGPGHARIAEAIGGLPRLIQNGRIHIPWREEGASHAFAYSRHPRTAVGFTAHADTLYWMTIDGRQEGYSAGMSLFELAEFMRGLGCTEAINLDGGGSTTLVVASRVVNRPSDKTGERPVANALLLVASAGKKAARKSRRKQHIDE